MSQETYKCNWPVSKEGWLNKQSEGMLGKKFQKRWFVLNGSALRYSHLPADAEARRVIALDQIVDISATCDKSTHFSLQLDLSVPEEKGRAEEKEKEKERSISRTAFLSITKSRDSTPK